MAEIIEEVTEADRKLIEAQDTHDEPNVAEVERIEYEEES